MAIYSSSLLEGNANVKLYNSYRIHYNYYLVSNSRGERHLFYLRQTSRRTRVFRDTDVPGIETTGVSVEYWQNLGLNNLPGGRQRESKAPQRLLCDSDGRKRRRRI